MAWFWTDDIARALIEAGRVTQDQVEEWLRRPVAVAADENSDLAQIGRRLLGLPADQLEEAGAA